MKQLYIREGRRFIKIENHEGMWYQKDGSFQKEKDKNSIGLCIKSTQEEETIMEINTVAVSYEDIINLKDKTILPTYEEFLHAQIHYHKELELAINSRNSYWIKAVRGYVNTDFGYVAKRSGYSGHSDGGVGCLSVIIIRAIALAILGLGCLKK